jgi:hypothetical protein
MGEVASERYPVPPKRPVRPPVFHPATVFGGIHLFVADQRWYENVVSAAFALLID